MTDTSTHAQPAKEKPIILIVEDNNQLRASMRDWLDAICSNCIIIEAADGEGAVVLAAAHHPAIVIMDVGLPNMSGIDAAKIIKAADTQARIIVLSIHEATPFRIAAANAGAEAFIPKRTMATELAPLVKTLLSDWRQLYPQR